MALDFPAAPVKGTLFSPAGGPSYVFDGRAWLPAVPALRRAEMPMAVVARNIGNEKLPVGACPLLGAYDINIGGWNYGPNGSLMVPKTGQYMLRNRVYHNPQPTDPSGRVGFTLNGEMMGNFVHLPSATIASCTLENTTVETLNKGDIITYHITIATACVYTMFRHTEVLIFRLPDEWVGA